MTVAALYVDGKGVYANLPDVEVWDEKRDARLYDGPWPVVAHPPCSTWCQLASVNHARYGYPMGSFDNPTPDDGCFAHALESVRRHGGVLEHPAYSLAWSVFGLNRPPSSGEWIAAGFEGGWTAHVEQGLYGHDARKATWLYAFGVELADLRRGRSTPKAWVSWADSGNAASLPRIGKRKAAATPTEFRDVLLDMARSAK